MLQTTVHSRHRIGHNLIVSGLFLFLISAFLLSTISSVKVSAFGSSVIFDLTNQARVSNGLERLELNQELVQAAQAKAEAMVVEDYFEHTSPSGTTGWDYIDDTGYVYTFAGENLAASNEDDASVVEGWLNSPGHRANLLNQNFSEIGIGIAYKDDYEQYRNVYFIVVLYTVPALDDSVAVAKTNTTAAKGLELVKEGDFAFDRGLGYIFVGVSGALTLSGISVETNKIKQHFQKHRT